MKRMTLAILLTATIGFAPVIAAGADEVPAEDRERIAELFESIAPEDIHSSPIEGWYTIRKGSVVAYISTDGRYLLQGDIIDLDQQVNLTEESRSLARRDLMSAVTDDQVIAFSPDAQPDRSVHGARHRGALPAVSAWGTGNELLERSGRCLVLCRSRECADDGEARP
jgi:thiol:disulfide interchange protein DsbC